MSVLEVISVSERQALVKVLSIQQKGRKSTSSRSFFLVGAGGTDNKTRKAHISEVCSWQWRHMNTRVMGSG